jgi:hypothetical protein
MQLYIYRLLEQNLKWNDLTSCRLAAGTLGWDESQKLIDYDGLRKKLMHDNAGTKALAWLLKNAKCETLDSTSHPIFMQATASCIVGGGKIDFWWDMITIRHAPKLLGDKTVSDTKYSQNRWSSLLILSLLEGQKFWPKEGNSTNGCLATFLKVVRFNNRQSSTVLFFN